MSKVASLTGPTKSTSVEKGPLQKLLSKRDKKKEKRSFGRFEVLPDFRAGDPVPDEPQRFTCEFRLMRRVLRWVKRHGVVHDGQFSMYVKHQDVQRNKPWRTIDLSQSVVSFRKGDQRVLINTLDDSPELYRLKLEDERFKLFVKAVRQHRLYQQWKRLEADSPGKGNVAAATPVPVPGSTPTAASKATAAPSQEPSVSALNAALAKLERVSDLQSKVPASDVGNAQKEYLEAAKDVQQKIQALLKSDETRSIESEPVKKTVSRKSPLSEPQRQKQPPPSSLPGKEPPKQESRPEPKPSTSPAKARPQTPAPARTIQVPKQEKTTQAPVKLATPSTPPVPVTSTSSQPVKAPSPAPMPSATKEAAPTKNDDETSDEEEKHVRLEKETEEEETSEEDLKIPVKKVRFRQKLPAPMGPAPSLFRLLFSAIGRDINHLPLPASAMEPLGTLQVLCEELEYSELIDHAISEGDPVMRMAYVAALAVSAYAQTHSRAGRKPFNPLLGETFEYSSPQLGWRYVAEQVSHHPAVSACYAEGPGWCFWQDRQFLITFGGNSVEAKVVGIVYLHLEQWKETYRWNKVTSLVTGVLSGSPTIDHHGDLLVLCEQTKMTAKVHFQRMSKDNRGDVQGKIMDEDEEVVQKIHGNWTDSLYVGDGSVSKSRKIWHISGMPPDSAKYYGFSRFAMSLNEIRSDVHGTLPKTDTRLRPDQKALEMGRPEDADKIKADLENRQRQRKKEMDTGLRAAHKPIWFRETGNEDGSRGSRWQFTGAYWKAKSKKFRGYEIPKLW